MKRLLATIFVLAIVVTLLSFTPGVPKDVPSVYTGMVATSHPLASLVGARILQQGGNAVDAAVAIQFALNVVEPMMSGIGGGGFMMIYLSNENKVVVIDYREKAPAGAKPTMFLNAEGKPLPFRAAILTGHAIGVPGTLKGMVTALEKFGTMSLAQVIEPAIELAEKGVMVNRVLAQSIKDSMYKFNEAAKQVFSPNGEPLPEGALLVQPDLAKTFKLIRDHGPDIFYKGDIAKAIVEAVQSRGGTMTLEDLANYEVKFREPIRGTYRGYEIVSMPPPSSGGLTLLQMLKILEVYDIHALGHNTTQTLHLMIEAMRIAYADRGKYLADADFVQIPFKGYLDDRYIEQRRSLIDFQKANPNIKPGNPWEYGETDVEADFDRFAALNCESETSQTTHYTVRDKWGNLVACTTTIEDVFGSGLMVPGFGFILNNEMTDFDFVPGGANEVQPGKRPRSSMTPTIVFKDGKPIFSVGSPGGARIITTVMQVIMNMIDHGMSVQEAINAPRIFSSSYPTVQWEAGIAEHVKRELELRGHKMAENPIVMGSVQSIVIDLETGKLYGGADPRREGTVIGVP
ncbi:gamma-glutamyltranspeptidase [Thermotoga sp. Ku-13t]|uniref:gamma-glutamyltransferase n=1 Tax=Thermotoga sp. Ku-13t TaxID=1755813 RepID=UPI001696E436|nr:gamma-glutamyltransferase [Thermotoga sp. Ku-13t]KAF2958687.1 gamma-glutamyltranspeptidase [Thermotoga sp. Ku-13t]